jgi:hypothetical protein
MWHFANLRFADHIFFTIAHWRFSNLIIFEDLNLPKMHNFSPYKHKLKMLQFKFIDDMTYVGKQNIRGKPMRIWIRNTKFFFENCDFRKPRKFADLRLAA